MGLWRGGGRDGGYMGQGSVREGLGVQGLGVAFSP